MKDIEEMDMFVQRSIIVRLSTAMPMPTKFLWKKDVVNVMKITQETVLPVNINVMELPVMNTLK